jgi:hypothetical protein
MQRDAHYDTRFKPSPFDSSWKADRTTAKPSRATYQTTRWIELDQIRRLYSAYRQLLGPLRTRRDDNKDIFQHDKEEHGRSELYLSYRVLAHAVEGYLLGCVEYPTLTAEEALRRATNTQSLIDLLEAEEDLIIRTFGLPWVEEPSTSSECSLNRPQPPGAGNMQKEEAATPGTSMPWSWPWR